MENQELELSTSTEVGLLNAASFNQMWRVAQVFAKSDLVPAHFKGKVENCMIAFNMASRMNIDPFMLMQNMYVIHGKPGIEAKLSIALANASGVFSTPINFKITGTGTTRGCTAFATTKGGELCEMYIDMEVVKKEGWDKKPGSKWQTIPDLMLKYRSASWLIKTHCPEVLFGMSMSDELEDIKIDKMKDITPFEELVPQELIPEPAPAEKKLNKKKTVEIKVKADPQQPGF